MARQHVTSGAPWEDTVGYSRAIRVGDHIHVSGTTALDDAGEVVGIGDAGRQTEVALEIIEAALEEAGASIDDVVRTCIYVTDVEDTDAVGAAHGAVFGEVKPASTMVEVSGLVVPEMLVEIEATAIIQD